MASMMDEQRHAVRVWIEGIEQRFRVGKKEIGDRSGVSPATIYRWFDDAHPFNPSLTAMRKIAGAFGVPMPSEGQSVSTGMNDGDLQQVYEAETLAELTPGNNQGVWRVRNRALELAGYLPGDLLLVDMSVEPVSGDVVCAQVYNLDRSGAETKLRVFEAPFLMTRTMDQSAADRPLFVDRERVFIAGTVVRTLRVRAA